MVTEFPALAQAASIGPERQRVQIADSHFAYFFGASGEFLKLERVRLSITALWALPLVAGNDTILPEYVSPHSHVAQQWLSANLTYNSRLKQIYGVFPKRMSERAEEQVAIIALQLPELRIIADIDVSQAPDLLVTPDGRRLFASSVQQNGSSTLDNIIAKIDIYDTSTFKRIDQIRETVPRQSYLMATVAINSSFQKGAYFSDDGTIIYNRLEKIKVLGNGMHKEHINPIGLLSSAQKVLLRPFETTDAITGKPWLPFSFSDSASGLALIALSNASRTRNTFISIDLDSVKILSIVESPPGRAHLTSDGRNIVLEEIEWRQEMQYEKKTDVAYKTGRFLIYNPFTGNQISELRQTILAGPEDDHKLICIAPSNDQFFYLAGSELYAIRITVDTLPVRIQSDFIASQGTECIFSDR
jgi:hypothetical protein